MKPALRVLQPSRSRLSYGARAEGVVNADGFTLTERRKPAARCRLYRLAHPGSPRRGTPCRPRWWARPIRWTRLLLATPLTVLKSRAVSNSQSTLPSAVRKRAQESIPAAGENHTGNGGHGGILPGLAIRGRRQRREPAALAVGKLQRDHASAVQSEVSVSIVGGAAPDDLSSGGRACLLAVPVFQTTAPLRSGSWPHTVAALLARDKNALAVG